MFLNTFLSHRYFVKAIIIGGILILFSINGKAQTALDTLPQQPTAIKKKKPKSLLSKKEMRIAIQRAICDMVSPIDYSGRKQKFVGLKDIRQIKQMLCPGDILIKRNEYQLTNIGIPGFWTHAAIYIGGEKEIDQMFDSIPLIYGLRASEIIKCRFPILYKRINNRQHGIIEAIGKGVVINPLSHCAKVDCLAAFRPKLSQKARFISLLTAFKYYHVPYDFLFDFESDDAVVCSELVYKAYSSNLAFKTGTLSGKLFLSPNDIAIQFCDEYLTSKPHFQLLFFYKGDSKKRKAFLYGQKEFCELQ